MPYKTRCAMSAARPEPREGPVPVYLDENMAAPLAHALSLLQDHLNGSEDVAYRVRPLGEVFGRGAADEDWIPAAGREGAIVLTQDLRIRTTRHQRELYQRFGLGVFFFSPPSKTGYSFWGMVEKVIRTWPTIKKLDGRHARPYAFRCTQRSDRFDPI